MLTAFTQKVLYSVFYLLKFTVGYSMSKTVPIEEIRDTSLADAISERYLNSRPVFDVFYGKIDCLKE